MEGKGWGCHQRPGCQAQGAGASGGHTWVHPPAPTRRGEACFLAQVCSSFQLSISPLFFFPDPSPSTGPRNGTRGPSLPCRWPVLWPFGASHRPIRYFIPKAPAHSPAWASRVPALALTLREACSTLRPFKIQKKPGAVGFSIKNLNGLSSKWRCAHTFSSKSLEPGPNIFGTREWFHGRQFLHGPVRAGMVSG